jgi:NAD+ diphosphatase
VTPLGELALSRGTVDRVTHRRTDEEWLDAAWADPLTRVLVVSAGRALVRMDDSRAQLVFVSPREAPAGTRFLLGQDADGIVYFGASAELPGGLDGVRAAWLREVGTLLGDRDAGLLTHAVALANWHDTHTHCPLDGTPTVPDPAGHSAMCPKDGSEHFPRTDPAVIMLITDPDDRVLLARNAAWPGRRVSILAGFVEPGESAEQAVIREVAEETGIKVTNVRYVGSQPWPMPRSLMLGFRADAPAGQAITVDQTELAEAHWYSREELLAAVKARELGLPPPVSIARHIIESWFGGPVPLCELGPTGRATSPSARPSSLARPRSPSCGPPWRGRPGSACSAPGIPSTTWRTRPAPRSAWPGCHPRSRWTRRPRSPGSAAA